MAQLAATLAAASIGAMIFFSGLIAPTAFRALPAESAGAFVRALFPNYFLVNGFAGVVASLLALPSFASALLLVGGAALVALRILVMPAVNNARNAMTAGNALAKATFARWHRLSVVVNIAAIALYALAVWLLLARAGAS